MSTVAKMVSTARAVALARKLAPKNTPPPSSSSAATQANQAAVKDLSSNQFTNEVEKHLSDYAHGKAELSKDTAGKLQVADEANGQLLQNIDPRALRNYGAYGSFMSYEKRARYVSGIYSAAKNINELKKVLNSA